MYSKPAQGMILVEPKVAVHAIPAFWCYAKSTCLGLCWMDNRVIILLRTTGNITQILKVFMARILLLLPKAFQAEMGLRLHIEYEIQHHWQEWWFAQEFREL